MKKTCLVVLVLALAVFLTGLSPRGAESEQQLRVVVVDESRTFEVSMQVQGLVSTLREQSMLEVQAQAVEVDTPTQNPLTGDDVSPVDVVIIVPYTIETGAMKQVWVVTVPLSMIPLEQRRETRRQLERLKIGIEEAFQGTVEAVGVHDDLIPAYFSNLFLLEGVLR
ncbi:MAG: hypothetical protein ACOCZX_04795 [Candidatus Bipolaricaulota bacterium]